MSTKVFDMDISGLQELVNALEKLPDSINRKISRKALKAAAKPIIKAARTNLNANKRTGTLAKSLGVKVVPIKGKPIMVAILGPRKDKWAMVEGKKVNPIRYIHMLERGVRSHEITVGKAGALHFNGAYAPTVTHPGHQGTYSLTRAFQSTKKAAVQAYADKARTELVKEVAKLKKGKGK